ncbi:hypothetical protein SLEP1_g28741 [Rubroshorea leprosula]|uniref:Uncharacterized protein n=1 Tax=Rubroshorea leprosula TaxID=152421 RepID=A0AAV5JX86_9ROSI|nr:hypothetical protein SLEP1_g28741 [Rubroshorea leprosula]
MNTISSKPCAFVGLVHECTVSVLLLVLGCDRWVDPSSPTKAESISPAKLEEPGSDDKVSRARNNYRTIKNNENEIYVMVRVARIENIKNSFYNLRSTFI